MQELDYPFDSRVVRRKKLSLKRKLLEQEGLMDKKIAVLGGSTTAEIKDMLELFLLNEGIRPSFFESEYAQYWQDAVFGNEELKALKPDIIFIHTTSRNISEYPELSDPEEEISRKLDRERERFQRMWDQLSQDYSCPIIQNNFEYPPFRLLGNLEAADPHGRVNFISRLNACFAEYARHHSSFYLNDINYQAAEYGLDRWHDLSVWYLYKYALSLEAIPFLAFQVSNIIKSIFGRNKKALALDLDNTLWGGVVGDDGPENLELGPETGLGEAYLEFQAYLKELSKCGILLTVISKNDEENALAGLSHPQMVLKSKDFISVTANWEPKSENLKKTAQSLNLLPESFVFVDDNPAEREIVRQQVSGAGIPELSHVEGYIAALDRAGYFEATTLSGDDLKRSEMYRENAKRAELQASFSDYGEYLASLEMKAEIKPFSPVYMARIAQLTNKSNQFNLTTRRYTEEEIRMASAEKDTVTLYGALADRFGDNGVVSVVIAREEGEALRIILWLMSCRVLKRGMEDAMMDELVRIAVKRGKVRLIGEYIPTQKNRMVKDFYPGMGFVQTAGAEDGSAEYELTGLSGYEKKNRFIRVNEGA
ncbi:MAG: HAD-IIIC family phosphatase [Lachnospiraceae bacterium]|nr:HAD-IIIC family phosphatase [Lachnospiraceae bacterium]